MASAAIEAALARMEHHRSRTLLLMFLRIAAIALPAFYVSWLIGKENPAWGIGGFVASLAIVARILLKRGEDLRESFKEELLPSLVLEVDPGLDRYDPQGMPMEELSRSNLFAGEQYWASKDLVSGRIGGIPVRFAMGRVRTNVGLAAPITFEGLVFIADFNKHFAGRTVVRAGAMARIAVLGAEDIAMEHPRFAAEFTVKSTDPVEARYLLTPDLCERLLDLYEHSSLASALFEGGNIVLALAMPFDVLEPRPGLPMDMAEAEAMLGKLKAIASLVEHLELDTRIWSKR